MSSFATLGLFSLLLGGPGPIAGSTAELGGKVLAHGAALPAVVPITVRLYEGAIPVATAQADLEGAYSLTALPGAYWLQVKLGDVEARVEKIELRAGSWSRDLEVEFPAQRRPPDAVAEVCGQVRGLNGGAVPAAVAAYSEDACVAGTRADVTGRYCLAVPPGEYWLKASIAGTDVAYERVRAPHGSFQRDLRSIVDVVDLPPMRVTSETSGRTSAKS